VYYEIREDEWPFSLGANLEARFRHQKEQRGVPKDALRKQMQHTFIVDSNWVGGLQHCTVS
jgi:hypothetical protein